MKPITEYKVADVTPFILKSTKAQSIVLDGEILMYDIKKKEPLPFVSLSKSKKTSFSNAVSAVFLFDILYLNGQSLMDKPINERRELLEKEVVIQENRVMLSDYLLCTGTPDQVEALLAARMQAVISNKQEGLVLKGLETIYEPNARHWLKMKKDYLKGMADSVDLVVLGGYFGTGSKGGLISVYLMGVYDKKSDQYKTVCKVGNGHDDATIDRLDRHFRPLMEKINQDYSSIPSWLDCNRGLVPDFVMKNPRKSQVWEITGAEFSISNKHTAGGYSVRFPRVTKIRDDKGVEDATTLSDFLRLVDESSKKAPTLLMNDDNDDGKKKRKRNNNGNTKTKRKKKDDDDDEPDEPEPDEDYDPDARLNNAEEEEEDVDENDDQESDSPAPQLFYVYGDFTKSIGTKTKKVFLHCVDDRGSWSDRGTMGLICKDFGDCAKDQYEKSFKEGKNNKMSDIQMVPIDQGPEKDKSWICNLICQKYIQNKSGAPPIHYMSFENGLKELAIFIKNQCESIQVHFSKFHHSVSNLDFEKVEKILHKHIEKEGIELFVYTRDHNDKAKVEASKHLQSSRAKPANPPSNKQNSIQTAARGDPQSSTTSSPAKPIFASVSAVISGYSPDETAEISQKIFKLGGRVQDKWEILASKSTHLVCESETNVFEHVSKLGGTVVTRSWIDDCEMFNTLLTVDGYEYPSKQNKKKKVPVSSKVSSVQSNLQPEFKDIFNDFVFYVHANVANDRQVKRYAVVYAGEVVSEFSAQVTHIIADSVDEKVKQFAENNKRVAIPILHSGFIWDCINTGTLVEESNYQIKV